jgi:hypothetical protein
MDDVVVEARKYDGAHGDGNGSASALALQVKESERQSA